jgi:branched-chain amino acid transport system substrate-binding protein
MKRISVFVCLALVMTAVMGCASSSVNNSSESNQNTQANNTANTQPSNTQPSETEKSTLSDEEIVIGAVFPLTGNGASYGKLFKQGSDLAMEDINNAGGINGKKLRIDYQDGRGEPKASVLAAQDLAAKGYPAVLASYTGATLAILPIAERSNMAVFNGGGQGEALAGASPNLFNTIPLLSLELDVLAKYIGEDTPFKTAYTIHVDDDSGRYGLTKFEEEFAKYGGRVLGSGSHKLGETNFRNILIKSKSSNPELLYISSHGQDAKLIIDQAREVGIKVQIINTSWTIIPEIISSPQAQGIIHTSLAFDPDKEWLDRFTEKFGTDQVSTYIANYYDAVMVFAKAYEHAVEKGYGTDGEAIVKAVNELKSFDSVNGKLIFNDDGTSVRDVNVSEIKENKSQLIKSY